MPCPYGLMRDHDLASPIFGTNFISRTLIPPFKRNAAQKLTNSYTLGRNSIIAK